MRVKWIWRILGAIAFWLGWLFLTGLLMFIHGDCWAGTTDAEAAACAHEKSWVGMIALASGALIFALGLWRIRRRRS